MHQQSSDDDLTSVTELPYFEGDFWPNVIEKQIKELNLKVQIEASGKVNVQVHYICIIIKCYIVVRD